MKSRSAGVKVWRSRSAGVKVWRSSISRSAGVKVWRSRSADVRVWRSRSAGVKVWRSRSAGVKVWSLDLQVWRCEDLDLQVCRCEDLVQRLLFYEEPFAGALGKKTAFIQWVCQRNILPGWSSWGAHLLQAGWDLDRSFTIPSVCKSSIILWHQISTQTEAQDQQFSSNALQVLILQLRIFGSEPWCFTRWTPWLNRIPN